MHSLPDNTLNPLGLLAEASLANRRAQQMAASSTDPPLVAASGTDQQGKLQLGVASATYFKPGAFFRSFHFISVDGMGTLTAVFVFRSVRVGPMTILPLRRLFIERQIQPEMLSFVSTEEVVALFKMCVFFCC